MRKIFYLMACASIALILNSCDCCNKDAKNADCTKKEACCAENGKVIKKIITAKVTVKPEHVDKFKASTAALIEKSRAEAGCISYSLFQDPIENSKFIFVEEWKDAAAIDFHFNTEHFKEFGKMLDEIGTAEVKVYDVSAEN